MQWKKIKNVDDLPEHDSIGKVTPNMEKEVNLFTGNSTLTLRQGAAKLKQKGIQRSKHNEETTRLGKEEFGPRLEQRDFYGRSFCLGIYCHPT
ncbi:hypothetical protein Trydic_g18804 [Trypoxylus dichotomus]